MDETYKKIPTEYDQNNAEYFKVVKDRNFEDFKKWIKIIKDDPADYMGMTAMHWAAKRGY